MMRPLLMLCLALLTVLLHAQQPSRPAPAPAAVLDPISPNVPAGPGEPALPQNAGFPVDVNNYENPLLLFQSEKRDLPMADEENLELLPPISPYLPGEQAPAGTPDKPLTPEELELRSLGAKVAASVVGIRVWDEFGNQISSGVGCFVTKDGVILTDTGLLHPEIAEKVDYITTTGADGTNHKVAGFYLADLVTGVTLLQSETRDTTPLELAPDTDFAQERACHVLAVSEKRGLVLADAKVQMDPALTGLGWLNLKGTDSPGAVGSPVLSKAGRVMAVVGMKVPLQSWMNFALPCDAAAFELRKNRAPMQPLSKLPQSPKLREVANDPEFVAAFATLQQKRVESAMRKLVQLTRKYPRSAECWALLGLSATYLGASPEALNCQRKAVALDPKAGLYWHQLAFAKLRESPGGLPDTTEDREALELAVEQRPNDQLAWLLLASRHVRDGDLGKADDALRRVTLLAPGYAQAHYLQAYVRGRLKDYDGAQAAISQSLKLNAGYSEAWYYQGLLFDKQGDPGEATKAYRNTVRLRPTHPQAWMNLAYAYKKMGRETEAREAFKEHQKRTMKAK
ncbi:tetratricopeptide repeat protein [Prosthecobacter dejongeii]|uniref:Tetratricopeptide (TPR) repeat protein n=1 Tax=Prosthecobacter dejongeii TaxID=48465 RepID=A0A7W8DR31_9BACT|nr:tetratricopeptide repeat protein [Prosthecobacter dejongeii]MBB5038840.1 tetratricopeptide (TPR) repeat protein [Prosthecobacter dejongeii]